jgi:7-cyano-7-deazaguanine synthase
VLETQPTNDGKICVLVSGGLDSCVLVDSMSKLFSEVQPLYIEEGLYWESAEMHWLEKFLAQVASKVISPLKQISLPIKDVYIDHWSASGDNVPDYQSDDREVYLPGRNLLLLSKTAVFCALNQIPLVALGILKGNPFTDSTPPFFQMFTESARIALNMPFQVFTPFSGYSKPDVIELGRHLPLHLSFSCVHPIGVLHCGTCNKCRERRHSFKRASVEDKTEYSISLPLVD